MGVFLLLLHKLDVMLPVYKHSLTNHDLDIRIGETQR